MTGPALSFVPHRDDSVVVVSVGVSGRCDRADAARRR
jgi:hypothetical protein